MTSTFIFFFFLTINFKNLFFFFLLLLKKCVFVCGLFRVRASSGGNYRIALQGVTVEP
jgi:hypothetical protein